MSIESEIQECLKSDAFQAFYTKAEEVMALTLESQNSSNIDFLHQNLVEMGRRYNHFIFTITEHIIEKSKNLGVEQDVLISAIQEFISNIEKEIQREFPLVFSFFLSYRSNTKNMASKN